MHAAATIFMLDIVYKGGKTTTDIISAFACYQVLLRFHPSVTTAFSLYPQLIMAAKSDPLTIEDPAIAKGSCILVTGINGYIGSHVGDQLLAAGYKVRGAVRNAEKAKWLSDLFEPYGKNNFSLVEIPDMTVDGALDDALKGKLFFFCSPFGVHRVHVHELTSIP
jgi:hypothetical protein